MVVAPFTALINASQANAAQITNRSLTLVAGTTDGGSKPGGVVNHKFTFTTTSATIGSIKLEYCTTASVTTCTLPLGVSTSTATLTGASGWASGATINTSTAGAPYITKSPAAGGTMTFQLNGVTNPTAANYTFFVRITTYSLAALGGVIVDTGTVAASTATPIVLTGTMPESIIFCTGDTVAVNCATAGTGTINFNQLFSPLDTATASSQFSASTNALSGYAVTVNGATLTSGSNQVTAMAAAGVGVRGTSQFGMNLAVNTATTSTVPVGAAITPTSDGTNLRALAATGYNTPDTFKFTSGDVIARSDQPTPGTAGPTNSQVYTVSYMVNVPGNLPAGTYSTVLTYICTATF